MNEDARGATGIYPGIHAPLMQSSQILIQTRLPSCARGIDSTTVERVLDVKSTPVDHADNAMISAHFGDTRSA